MENKLIVILGPTASGKTALAVKIANDINSEIISADSRQIYKRMNIGTGKDLHEYALGSELIPYHLIDILNPKLNYSVFQFKNDFHRIYKELNKKNKIPILCGGTALYIDSILFNYDMSGVAPNHKIRKQLEKLSLSELKNKLITKNKNIYDRNFHITKRRIIRTLEITDSKKKNINSFINIKINDPLVIGLDIPRDLILIKIKDRLLYRLQNGMIEEVEGLIKNGLDKDRLNYFGLEYKFIGKYLFKEISYDKMVTNLNTAINRFAKKQMTFFRRMEKKGVLINWINPIDTNKINILIKNYVAK